MEAEFLWLQSHLPRMRERQERSDYVKDSVEGYQDPIC